MVSGLSSPRLAEGDCPDSRQDSKGKIPSDNTRPESNFNEHYSIQINGFQEHRAIHSITSKIMAEGIRMVSPRPTTMGKCGMSLRCFTSWAPPARTATAPNVIEVKIMYFYLTTNLIKTRKLPTQINPKVSPWYRSFETGFQHEREPSHYENLLLHQTLELSRFLLLN